MQKTTLLPADLYRVINKTILTEIDKKNLINLYEPIIGALPISLYLTLYSDLDRLENISKEYTHHHLMTFLKARLDDIKEARCALESVGLLKSFLKTNDNLNAYVYELYSPLSAYEFFHHPILNIILYNNIGENEYKLLLDYYKKPTFNYEQYEEVSAKLNETFKSVNGSLNVGDIKTKAESKINLDNMIDYDLLKESIPKNILSEKAFNSKTKELINSLAFIYNLDSIKMSELIRLAIDEIGNINKTILTKEVRKYYEYNNSGNLPTIIYRTQPEYLKTPSGDTSNKGKMIYVFENTSPYDFLRSKYKNNSPTPRDLKLLEFLAIEENMSPSVINVLIDYVLKVNDNKLNKAYVETIAGQWSRLGIKTAKGAMEQAEKEYKKINKKPNKGNKSVPAWFDIEHKDSTLNKEEEEELKALLNINR